MEDQSNNEMSEGNFEESSKSGKWSKVFLLAIGFLLGVSIKAQAIKMITIGFNDYKLENLKSDFQLASPVTDEAKPEDETDNQANQQENVESQEDDEQQIDKNSEEPPTETGDNDNPGQ